MDFEKEVLDLSEKIPVLVDFWAPWCGPCKVLGPVLEELDQNDDRWMLVKVNSDENPDLSVQYGVRGIPAVKLISNKEVVAEFTGALPKFQIEKWLDDNIPDPRKQELEQIISSKDQEKLEKFVLSNSDLPVAKIELAKTIALTNPVRAFELVQDVPVIKEYSSAVESIKILQDFKTLNFGVDTDASLKIGGSVEAFNNGDFESCIALLIESILIDKSSHDEIARRTAISIFTLLGSDHELTKKFRRQFDMALY